MDEGGLVMAIRRSTKRNPLRDGTGGGVRRNTGRGGCEHPSNPNSRPSRVPSRRK